MTRPSESEKNSVNLQQPVPPICNEDDCHMANLEELGWPKAVMERLEQNAESLTDIKASTALIQAKQQDVLARLDKQNGRATEIERTLGAVTIWQAKFSAEHSGVLQSLSELKSDSKSMETWRGSISAEHVTVLAGIIEEKSDLKAIALRMASMESWKDRATGGADWIWKAYAAITTLALVALGLWTVLRH